MAKSPKIFNLIGNGSGVAQIKILGVSFFIFDIFAFVDLGAFLCILACFEELCQKSCAAAVQVLHIIANAESENLQCSVACSNWALACFENGTKTAHLGAFGPKSPRILI